jgi:glycosyltransferase involved in cell wall biosynthesis
MIKASVIVPCYNEETTIEQLLQAIYTQTYPLSELEVIIADGHSTDQTRSVINDFQARHPGLSIRIIDNDRRVIPSGLNRAIEAAQGQYIIRMDAHSIPEHEYIASCINSLESGLGDNVGGVWKIQPGESSWIANAIALAASHPLGAGDARYRIGGIAQEVDTVPFGAFRRDFAIQLACLMKPCSQMKIMSSMCAYASRRQGMDGSTIQSVYFARSTLKELARQYWRYGYWKAQMLRRYPKTLRWRQLIPPAFVLTLVSLALLSFAWYLARWLLAIIVLLYALVLFLLGIQMSFKHKDISLIIGVPMAIATIHFSWGTALLWGMLAKPLNRDLHR